jgi:hypothetical protein
MTAGLRRRTLLTLLLGAAAACVPAPAQVAAPAPVAVAAADSFVADRLYLGRSIPDGGTVSEEDWTRFVREVVTPDFPGFTVYRVEGYWMGERESTFVLELLHRATVDTNATVDAIAAEYRRRFRQQAVLRVTSPARMRLYKDSRP